MIVTRYEMVGTHDKENISFEVFMIEFERFKVEHSTIPTRIEMNPVFYSDVTASDDAKKYALESENKSYYLRQIYGLDVILSPDIPYENHRFVMEKIVSR